MELLKPKYKPTNREVKRKSYNEYKNSMKSVPKKLKEIENNFLKALFIDNGATYEEIFVFYNNMFLKYAGEINLKLQYNYLDKLVFIDKYKPLENV